MTAKEILLKVKALFEAPVIVPPVVPAAAADLVVPTPTVYKLKDGSEISVTISGTELSAGDLVTIAGAPAPAGDYELEDGTKLTVDSLGKITLITAPSPATQPYFVAPVVKTLEERIAAIESIVKAPGAMAAIEGAPGLTTEQLAAMYSKFATGTPEERLSNLEVMIKALMECNFGYQIRQGQENEAIKVYKDSLTPVQSSLAAAEQKITKQGEVINGLFELVEKLIDEPSADPVTLTPRQKEKFERSNIKEERLHGYAEAIKKNKQKV